MKKKKSVAVIGGGPAGLFAALGAAACGAAVTLFERNRRPGAKLLLSGSGQCNLTHGGAVRSFLSKYGPHGKWVRQALEALPPQQLRQFFESRGVPLIERPDGKVFPRSGRAGDLLRCLEHESAAAGVALLQRRRVASLAVSGTGGFRVGDDHGELFFDRVVVAAGGCSYPKTGSSGDGFRLAGQLGHTVITPRPGLAAVSIVEPAWAGLSGLSLRQALLHLPGADCKQPATGDLLFTGRGLSGPLILDNSRSLSAGDEIRITLQGLDSGLLQEIPERAFDDWAKRAPGPLLRDAGVPAKIAAVLLQLHGLSENRRLCEISKAKLKQLVAAAAAIPFTVKAIDGFETAMVTCGGVSLTEVDPAVMCSRLVPGLYFAGEVLDVDGDSGGYNIQFACSSGWLAGRSAAV